MKQNRFVSCLPFSVFNCQGSRHHPAGHAEKFDILSEMGCKVPPDLL